MRIMANWILPVAKLSVNIQNEHLTPNMLEEFRTRSLNNKQKSFALFDDLETYISRLKKNQTKLFHWLILTKASSIIICVKILEWNEIRFTSFPASLSKLTSHPVRRIL